MRISDWSSDVCSSDLGRLDDRHRTDAGVAPANAGSKGACDEGDEHRVEFAGRGERSRGGHLCLGGGEQRIGRRFGRGFGRSEEHMSELQSLMRNSDADCGLKTKIIYRNRITMNNTTVVIEITLSQKTRTKLT